MKAFVEADIGAGAANGGFVRIADIQPPPNKKGRTDVLPSVYLEDSLFRSGADGLACEKLLPHTDDHAAVGQRFFKDTLHGYAASEYDSFDHVMSSPEHHSG